MTLFFRRRLEMRFSVPAMILSLTFALPATGWTAGTPTPAAPGPTVARGEMADDVAAPGQQPCEGDQEPGVFASALGRFVNPTECEPHWSFTADGVVLQRSGTRSQPLFTGAPNVAAVPELLNARHFDSPAELGFQLGAIRHGPCGWDLELGYFQIDGWNANSTISGESVMMTGESSGFLVTDAEAQYKSNIHLAEINLRRQWCDGLTLLVGFRAGELNEFYGASGIGARSPVPISLNINTFNHLYGFQTGADYEFYNMGGPLKINALCKAGIYGNSAMQSSRLIESGTSDDTLDAHRYQAAFMGEAGAVATYQVTCHLSLRASCQAVWIEGVALAPEQISANDFTGLAAGIDTHGGLFYYGGGLGAELKF
jgi:hypothetical protein